MQNKVFVYFSRLIEDASDIKVYPLERQLEILSCTSKKVISEKYTAWKLLERALKEQFDTDIEKVNFEKQKNGKWVMDKGYFSISHSNGVCLVALLDTPVGIDLEKPIKVAKRLCDRLLTEKEFAVFNTLPEKEKESYISKMWTKKESIFKFLGSGVFSPKEIESENYFTITKNLTLFNEEFLMSITTEKKTSEIVFLQKDFE